MFTVICSLHGYSQNIDAGTISISVNYENRSSIINTYATYDGLPIMLDVPSNNSINIGSDWITEVSYDGKDEDEDGDKYFGNDDVFRNSTIGFSLNGGYFLIDGLMTGLRTTYSRSSTYLERHGENEYSGQYGFDQYGNYVELTPGGSVDYVDKLTLNYNMLSIEPFIKYFIPIGKNAIFLGASYEIGKINQESISELDYDSNPVDWMEDDDETTTLKPRRMSNIGFETGMSFSIIEIENGLSISFEPAIHFKMMDLKQDVEIYTGYSDDTYDMNGNVISYGEAQYEFQEMNIKANAFYFSGGLSIRF